MRNDNWGSGQADRSSQNYTQRFHRQSRITGQWSRDLSKQRRIPAAGYICAVLAVMAFWLANFL
jgi:hypothetical protein